MGTWRWQDFPDMLLGVWIAASPWVLGFADEYPWATWNAVIIGGVILVLAAIDLEFFSKFDEWAMSALGAWSIASPWALGFAGHRAATVSMVVAGIAVVALTLWELAANSDKHKPLSHVHGQ
jgi:hypothetical protein